jgi:hypothetical protein
MTGYHNFSLAAYETMNWDRARPRLSTKYLVSSTPAAIALAGILAMLVGCNSGEFPTAPVTGRVICEGKPVPHVRVYFEPLGSGIVGPSGFATVKEDGTFVLTSYKEGDGAVIGKHRVRVGPPHHDDFPKYKCDCYLNADVDLIEEVEVKKGKNEFELVLKKKTGREPPLRKDD